MNEFKDITELSDQVIKAATEVHQIIGPGMMESVYQECLSHELNLRDIPFERQKELTIEYKDATLDGGYRLDFVVADQLIVELKSGYDLKPDHATKLLTYLFLTGLKEGLLINQFSS
jgi:GxxExxY protein